MHVVAAAPYGDAAMPDIEVGVNAFGMRRTYGVGNEASTDLA